MNDYTCSKSLILGKSGRCTLNYNITETLHPDFSNTVQYGINISVLQTGEKKEIQCITSDKQRIQEIFEMLVRNDVTPTTLKDIIEDIISN